MIAGGAAATLTANGRGRFESLREQASALFERLDGTEQLPERARPRLFGGFSFTDAHAREASETWKGYPGARFVLPEVQLTVLPSKAWLTTSAVGPGAAATATRRLRTWRDRLAALPEFDVLNPPGVRSRSAVPGRKQWRRQVRSVTDRIERNHLEKVVLAQSLTARLEHPLSVTDTLHRLGTNYPDCYRFLFEPESGNAFFGATPERLVTVEGRHLETEALAGSIGRGENPREDETLATELLESHKNTHEHELVVDAIREQLSAFSADLSFGERQALRLANVQHLHTPIHATLDDDEHVLSLVDALHPTPAVGGLPPEDALRTIRETETFHRGWYAAPVGWFDGDGNGTFAVAIRSGIANGRTATLFAGAGIVADSDPDREYEELQLKYRPILDELE